MQVFDNTPVSKEGTLQSGDEIIGVNGATVKGKTKVEVAKMIQSTGDEVIIHYNKLHAENVQGESLDIALKKIKHRLVENMSAKTADALGLSRAILCNDSLVKRLKELEGTEVMYRGLVDHCKRVLKSYFNIFQTMHSFGTEFCQMSIREPQPTASEAYRSFGEMHRGLEKDGIAMIKALKPVVANFGTYLNKAIPDTKLTVRRYADSKFAYLSYCLKVKEMDDEEQSFNSIQEPLYRVETGNYEYRLILRCRQEARAKFARLRNDVLEKIELLEAKHAENLADNLTKLLEGLAKYTKDSIEKFDTTKNLFPIEVDLKSDAFTYKSQTTFSHDGTSVEEEVQPAEEAKESRPSEELLTKGGQFSDDLLGLIPSSPPTTTAAPLSQNVTGNEISSLISGIQDMTQPKSQASTDELLAELGLDEVILGSSKADTRQSAPKPFSSIDDLLN